MNDPSITSLGRITQRHRTIMEFYFYDSSDYFVVHVFYNKMKREIAGRDDFSTKTVQHDFYQFRRKLLLLFFISTLI